jgi:Ca2+/H+ antiporter, TMEM165/GDT1 family
MMNKKFWIKKIVGFSLLAIAGIALLTWVVMLLWNGVLAEVVSVSTVTYWQALGLLVLSKILFGGFRGKGGDYKKRWKEKMEAKLEGLSPEEREKIKEEWRNRCNMWKRNSVEPDAENRYTTIT